MFMYKAMEIRSIEGFVNSCWEAPIKLYKNIYKVMKVIFIKWKWSQWLSLWTEWVTTVFYFSLSFSFWYFGFFNSFQLKKIYTVSDTFLFHYKNHMKIKIHLQHDEMTTRSYTIHQQTITYSLLMNLINQVEKNLKLKMKVWMKWLEQMNL